jgi:opacity protein-like surface antigen
MRIQRIHSAFLVIGIGALGAVSAHAQADAVRNLSRTDVAVSLYGAFSGATTGNNVEQSPSNSAGGLFEMRHIANPIMGFEGTYSFNRANQTYSPSANCGVSCGNITPTTISADAHEVTGDWVPSLHLGNLRPFAVLGVGLLFNVPSSGQTSTSSSTKPVFVYGAGLDWGVLPHIGLRMQYRGNLYQAPDVTRLYTSSGVFTRTAEPMVGAYLRF